VQKRERDKEEKPHNKLTDK